MQTIQTAATPIGISVRQVEVRGANFAYIEKGAGEAVVFIHGAVSDYRTWLDQVEFFAPCFRAVSYSRRYHQPNRSAAGEMKYSHAAQAADLAAFLKALGLERAHLVGHSYGAALALIAALDYPELIASLVLAEPSPFPNLLDSKGRLLLEEQRAGFGETVRLARAARKEEAVRQFLHTVVGIDAWCLLPRERRAVVMENADTLESMLETYYDAPRISRRQLKNVTVPVLLVTGELSPRLARRNNELLSRCLPNSQIGILRGASHGLQIENPAGFNRMVFDFLTANQIGLAEHDRS